jgi:hypothetical protein
MAAKLFKHNVGSSSITIEPIHGPAKEGSILKRSPLLTVTRAAAFCDLGSWEAAKMEIGKVLSLEKKNDAWRYSEPYKLLNRIKAARLDLLKRK